MPRISEIPKTERLKQWLVSSSGTQKIVFLAWLSHELTIYGRCYWLDLTGEKQGAAFKGLNELQHKISQDIVHLAQGTNRFSGERIWESLQQTAASYGLSADLHKSLERLSSVLAPQIN